MFVSSTVSQSSEKTFCFRRRGRLSEETVETYLPNVMIGHNIAQSFSHLCHTVSQCLLLVFRFEPMLKYMHADRNIIPLNWCEQCCICPKVF